MPTVPEDVSLPKLILGVDGGGTKTQALLATVSGAEPPEVIGSGSAGASNLRDRGASGAVQVIRAAIEQSYQDAGTSDGVAAVAVLAIAGAADENLAAELQTAATSTELAERVIVVSDSEPLLAAGTPNGWGVALIAGTGSLAFGKDQKGNVASAGGFGYLIGDEGSGYWLGQQALAACIQAHEGRGDSTELLPALLSELEVKSIDAIKNAIYDSHPRQLIASLAPTVLRIAEQGDVVAKDIVDVGAEELAKLIVSVAVRLGLCNEHFALALAGGVLNGSQPLRELVLSKLQIFQLTADPVTVVSEPALGCVKLAARALNPDG